MFSNFLIFFFNDTATTEIYTLSLHDALPIYGQEVLMYHTSPVLFSSDGTGISDGIEVQTGTLGGSFSAKLAAALDRKSTRLNSSHDQISYAVFCLKKKKKHTRQRTCIDEANY